MDEETPQIIEVGDLIQINDSNAIMSDYRGAYMQVIEQHHGDMQAVTATIIESGKNNNESILYEEQRIVSDKYELVCKHNAEPDYIEPPSENLLDKLRSIR